MNPVPFPGANKTFVKPECLTDEQCGSLPVHDTGRQLVSCWQPGPEDIAAVVSGRPIWLWICGGVHPVVAISTENPFPRPEER